MHIPSCKQKNVPFLIIFLSPHSPSSPSPLFGLFKFKLYFILLFHIWDMLEYTVRIFPPIAIEYLSGKFNVLNRITNHLCKPSHYVCDYDWYLCTQLWIRLFMMMPEFIAGWILLSTQVWRKLLKVRGQKKNLGLDLLQCM